MADSTAADKTTHSKSHLHSTSSLENLRTKAQEHLLEIEKEKSDEELDKATKARDLEMYKKSKTPSRSSKPAPTGTDAKAPSLRTAQDVLERIRWDPSLDSSHFVIGYLERFDGLKEMPAASWIRESTEEDFIPQHRIKYFKRVDSGQLVWSREGRIDRIFGSGLGAGDAA